MFSLFSFYFLSYFFVGLLFGIGNFLIGRPVHTRTPRFFKAGFIYNSIDVILKAFLAGSLFWCLKQHSCYWPSYFFMFGALIITIFTDLETFLISRYVTLYLIPVGWALSMFKMLPISPIESILGSIFGLVLLWTVKKIALRLLKEDGLGQGDIDLIAFIGAFVGPFGCWISVIFGSLLACVLILPYALFCKTRNLKIPFGVFLSLGAMTFVIFQTPLLNFFTPL